MNTTKVRFRVKIAGFPHMEAEVDPKRADQMILGGLAVYVDGVKPPGLLRREMIEAEEAEKAAIEKAEKKAEEREVATDKPKRGRRKAVSTAKIDK